MTDSFKNEVIKILVNANYNTLQIEIIKQLNDDQIFRFLKQIFTSLDKSFDEMHKELQNKKFDIDLNEDDLKLLYNALQKYKNKQIKIITTRQK